MAALGVLRHRWEKKVASTITRRSRITKGSTRTMTSMSTRREEGGEHACEAGAMSGEGGGVAWGWGEVAEEGFEELGEMEGSAVFEVGAHGLEADGET